MENHLDSVCNNNNNNPVLHIRGDSATELELLFSVLNKTESRPPIPPGQTFRNKNLPLSFFQPPEPKLGGGGHCRDGSIDGSCSGVVAGVQNVSTTGAFHSRSHSSPAKLPLALSIAPQQISLNLNDHIRIASRAIGGYEGLPENQPESQLLSRQPLQQQTSWPTYFNTSPWPNNASQQTQANINSNNNNAGSNAMPNSPHKPPSSKTSSTKSNSFRPSVSSSSSSTNTTAVPPDPTGPLPLGWEKGVTPDGDVYFINHIDKVTSWFDPRLPKHLQKPVISKSQTPLTQQQQPQQQQQQQPLLQLQQPQQQQQQQLLQPQQLQGQSFQQQNVLMLNTMQLPRLQQPQQLLLLSSAMSPSRQQSLPAAHGGTPRQSLAINEQLIRAELAKLQLEKERLQREQEENVRKETLLMKELLGQQTQFIHGVAGEEAAEASRIGQQQMDSFLAGAKSELQTLQNNAESGNQASQCGVQRSEFLNDIADIMDVGIDQEPGKSSMSAEFKGRDNAERPPLIVGLDDDVPTFIESNGGEHIGMDSDDLVSTLNDDVLGINSQIMDSLLWL